MRKALTGACAALVMAAGACGDTGGNTAKKVEVAGPEAIQNRLEAMPEAQRNGVFIRAIRDARQDCQNVESSQRAGEHQGFPVWTATCDGGGTFSIVIMNDGTAAVLSADQARLAGGNETAAQKGQGQ
ncbi:MAG: hypothetical protein M3177_09275 [Pseudomonadota bacterium]|nr:hypothetical protein [Pseudomonadota bacterium]